MQKFMRDAVTSQQGNELKPPTYISYRMPYSPSKYIPQLIDQMFYISVSQIIQFNQPVQSVLKPVTFAKSRSYTNNDHFFKIFITNFLNQTVGFHMYGNEHFDFFFFKVCIQVLSSGSCAFLKTRQYYPWLLRILFTVSILLWDITDLLYIFYFNIIFAYVRKRILLWQWANVHSRQILGSICLSFNYIKSANSKE